jgi:uncharacterized phage protein (TIGR02216 family)
MEAGLGRLKLAPKEFWAATPREIAGAFARPAQPLARATLDELMRIFPD